MLSCVWALFGLYWAVLGLFWACTEPSQSCHTPRAPPQPPDPLWGSVFSRSLHNAAASRVVHAQPQPGEEKPPEPLWSEKTLGTLHEALQGTSPARPDKRNPQNRTGAAPSAGPSRGDQGGAGADDAEPGEDEDGTEPHPGLPSLAWAEPGHGRPAVLEPLEEL